MENAGPARSFPNADGEHGLPPPIGIVRATTYAAGNFGKNVLWGAADLTLLYLMTDLMKIDAAVAGWAILISMIANMVLDPIIGNMVDTTRSPFGRSGPYILLGAPLFAGAFACLYTLPSLGVSALPITLAVLIIFRISFSIMDAPHNALLGTIVRSGKARSFVSALRLFFSSVATLTVAATLSGIVGMKGSETADLISRNAIFLAVLSVTAMYAGVFAVRRFDHPHLTWRIRPERLSIPPALFRSRPVVLMLAIIIVLGTGVPLFAKMIVFHAAHVAHDPARAGLILAAMSLGQMAGLIGCTFAARRMASVQLLALIMVCLIMVSLAVLMTGDGGWLADCLLAACFGACVSAAFTVIWVFVAECADEVRNTAALEANGAIFGLAIVAIKLGQGIAAAVAGSVLTMANYTPEGANSALVTAAITGLRGGGPLLAAIVVTFACWRMWQTQARSAQATADREPDCAG
jgi:glycoside/pentoside/hexuronide:cation symporter, GPH family